MKTKELLKKLVEAKHPYYASESNYYSNDGAMDCETLEEFFDGWENADIDMNQVFRWDFYDKSEDGEGETGYRLQVTIIQQRKGIYRPVTIHHVDENDPIEKLWDYFKKHRENLNKIWKPFT